MIGFLFIFYSIFNHAVIGLKASDFYVHDLPLWPKSISYIHMHAGHIPVGRQHSDALFFWHFSSKYLIDKPKTVIWLNGGPGCSSLIGAWMEIGPFRFQNEDTLVENNGSWHEFSNLLFIDQPIGTGFSYFDKNSKSGNLDVMTNQLFGFLRQYAEIFPEFLKTDIYFTGESFAGQYIPYIARMLLREWPAFKLRGLLIGSGYIDPASMYQSYLPFIVKNKLIEKDSDIYHYIEKFIDGCQREISKHMSLFADDCTSAFSIILKAGAMTKDYRVNQSIRCVNMYDVRLTDTYPSCGKKSFPDMEYLTSYLRRKDVVSQIHVDHKKSNWTQCNDRVFGDFLDIQFEPSVKLLPDLLTQIPIVLYNGEYDFVCNHLAIEEMIDSMVWSNRTGFDLGNGTIAKQKAWIVEGESAGFIRIARNLTYILFHNAGHLVPYNYPRRSRMMLHQFMERNFDSLIDPMLEKDFKENSQVKHYYFYQRNEFIVLGIILVLIISSGVIWIFVWIRRRIRLSRTSHSAHRSRSLNADPNGRELEQKSFLDEEKKNVDQTDITASV